MEKEENNASSFIKNCIGKAVIVKLNNKYKYKGTLISIDGAFNVYLLDSELLDSNEANKYKHLLIRGNNILFISPYLN